MESYLETKKLIKIIKDEITENISEAIESQNGKLPHVVFELTKF